MLRVAVDAVPTGAVLARTLYAPTGQPVLRAGHPLDHSVLPRLASFGIRFVWVDEPALAGLSPVEPLAPVTAWRAERALIRTAEAARGGVPTLPAALREELVDLAGQVADELEALGGKIPLPYPAGAGEDGVLATWIAGAMNRAVLAGLTALAGPYRTYARDFILAAWLQDVGLWRLPGMEDAPPAGTSAKVPAGTGAEPAAPEPAPCHPVAALEPAGIAAAHRRAAAHVAATLRWLSGVDLGGLTRALVAQHHEQRDGRGYPEGLQGEAIHPAARRLAAVTAYTLAVEGCAHRPGWLPHEAYEWLLAEGPVLWGDDVVHELAGLLYPYPPGSLVQLDGGPWGVVVDCAGARRLRPRVRLLPVHPGPGEAGETGAGEMGMIDLLSERTRQITAWALAWPAAPARIPGPAGQGR
ncbi:putative metal dependent phosphohydrolase [Thermaerobacter marianensis DSM 12885]|uniref:Metal dependent phosphohydrolase n=1 Tax=Thermaerobacter marianensis (strain ATCC 700841 / DSM 12885 / JCM 10246 / 7p75a) TaxID=644966 RepID=E6SJU1_THEM7|nr:HD domain-containing phosphohydrolase [Thermaerobacter marianensis]ADU52174.1 putative metal dependent phosphohydrolase [Thermaerobacter marianensis DSM 12885]